MFIDSQMLSLRGAAIKSVRTATSRKDYVHLPFDKILYEHNVGAKLDAHVLVSLIGAAATWNLISCGQQLHSYVMKSGAQSNLFIATSLVSMYAKVDFLDGAEKVFDEIPNPHVVSWNSLISGYVHSRHYSKALDLIAKLRRSDLQPDMFTFTLTLTACTQLSFLDLGKSVHCDIIKLGFIFNNIVGNCLIDMYGKCQLVEDAILAFHEMDNKDAVSWNSVIGASVRSQRISVAMDFLCQMPDPDTISYNEVISGIAQFGDMEDAKKILCKMPSPNSSSWNSIISGYIKRNQAQDALDFFSKMYSEEVVTDEYTFSSVIRGVAGLSALNWGAQIHCYTVKSGMDLCITVGSALVDMYSKCGQVGDAETMFCSLSKRNVVSWNAMLSGYAHNGASRKVVELFEQLRSLSCLKPDHITFITVLTACGRDLNLLNDGIQYFELMIKEYGIDPTAQLCSCMIDLLGQAGEISRAERVIYELGFESCGLVWRALLGACEACGEVRIAEFAASKVIELEGDDEFVYVLLSNMYASKGRWSDVSGIREMMRERGVKKQAGRTWIEL